MLEEAVDVMRLLWDGKLVNHHGEFYTVENARLYSVPDTPPPVAVSAFGPEAAEVAARIGDGFITVQPDKELLARYRSHGGRGPSIAALKVCWDQDEQRARKLAHELCRPSVSRGRRRGLWTGPGAAPGGHRRVHRPRAPSPPRSRMSRVPRCHRA
jgi:G6PDH family F420-dependent oxidoreductase